MQRELSAALRAQAMLLLLAAMFLQAAHPTQAVLPDSTGSSADTAATAARQQTLPNNHLWFVQLKDAPAVAYSGDIPGLAATRAQPTDALAASSSSDAGVSGRRPRFTASSAAAVQYASYISAQSEAAVARALGPATSARIVHRYSAILAGFTVGPLSGSEVRALRQDPNVASVTRDGRGYVKTISTPAFLGVSTPNGAWSQLGGWSKAAEGVIIGMVSHASMQ
jgi:hypothetical protein